MPREDRSPLQRLNGSAGQASAHIIAKQNLGTGTSNRQSMQSKPGVSAVKRAARPRAAKQVDFGVQIFAKPPPPESCETIQVCCCLIYGASTVEPFPVKGICTSLLARNAMCLFNLLIASQ